MANCVKINAIPVPPPPSYFQLTLTEAEAAALTAVFARIGGPPDTARGLIEEVHKALVQAGVVKWDNEKHPYYSKLSSTLDFHKNDIGSIR